MSKVCTACCSNQILFGHNLAYRSLEIVHKAQIPVCNYTYQLFLVIHNRNTTYMVHAHKFEGIGNNCVTFNCNRIVDHSILSPLHTPYMFHLTLYRHILVYNTYTTGTGYCNCQLSLCYCIHSCRYNRRLQNNIS